MTYISPSSMENSDVAGGSPKDSGTASTGDGGAMNRKEKRKILKNLKRKQVRREMAIKEREGDEARLNDPVEHSRLKKLEGEEIGERFDMERRLFEEKEKPRIKTKKSREEEEAERQKILGEKSEEDDKDKETIVEKKRVEPKANAQKGPTKKVPSLEPVLKEIPMLRDSNQDMSMLDLHGLHVLEAVHALEKRLMKIESVDRMNKGLTCKDATVTHPRQNVLHVITGTHSKGQASLSAAVKSFLIEKGYHFEEARPDVIDVCPKFLYKSQTRSEGKNIISNKVVENPMPTPFVPAELDDNTLYKYFRKDAIKLERAAQKHNIAADKAFWRREITSARQLYQQARDEEAEAKRLHSKAAEEILRVKNAKNGLWKIDLHGLHALEAVDAVEKRLLQIVTIARRYNGRRFLLVITGRGNHSKGKPKLPTAIENFCLEKRYYYEDGRPGTFLVRPNYEEIN